MDSFWFNLYIEQLKHYIGIKAEFEKQAESNRIRKIKQKEINIRRAEEYKKLAQDRDNWKKKYFELAPCVKKLMYVKEEEANLEARLMSIRTGEVWTFYMCNKHPFNMYHLTHAKKSERKSRKL